MSRLASLVEISRSKRKRLIVAAADDEVVLSSIKLAIEYDIVFPILVGPGKKVEASQKKLD